MRLPPPAPPAPAAPAHEPRWPPLLAALTIGLLYLGLPAPLTLGPPWLLAGLVAALGVTAYVTAHTPGTEELNERVGYLLLAVVTAILAYALARLLLILPTGAARAPALLRAGAALWAGNVLVFASWYWRLDAGGPHARAASHPRDAGWTGAFLFPQQTLDPNDGGGAHAVHWRPHFVDYLFLAFNTSTAFSPTDAPVLSRWAKGLMMVQALISFATVAVLAARAVNIL